KHLAFLLISILSAIFVLYFPNLDKLKPLNPYLVYLAIIFLGLVLMMGTTVKGGTRQLGIGFISFQPSFFARLALVFFFASYLDKKHEELLKADVKSFLSDFAPIIMLTAVIFILIILEKHLSTLIISGLTLLGVLTYAGLRYRLIGLILLVGLLGGIIILTQGDDYRSKRLEIYKKYSLFLRSDKDIKIEADDYQVKESLTALSSGGLLGTGIARGRAKHYYLPEARTDYIYTVIGEEFGFLGAFVVFALHCLLFFRAFRVANRQENRYLQFLCAGVAMNIFFNTLVNVGVSISILPPTGNTLPFVSYGGSALLFDSIGVGVILNISAKRRYV
ncbi:MAG TPA: FtsW/RodA/SpoVE family cell cycle protein, partial [Candidatus Cloacimonadota bacterium]|nr:FtsW/RodA/SpoVE family cell cycle protein [Candidatus Cloacimonadota bacterium]